MALLGRMVRTCTLVGVAVALSGAARADLITNFVSSVWNGTDYTYTYQVDLSTEAYIDNGGAQTDLSTIVDFWNYVPGTATVVAPFSAADWSITEQNTGIYGYVQSPPDFGSIPNITFTYVGAYKQNASTTLDLPVLRFTLRSTQQADVAPNTFYTATSTDLNPLDAPQGNTGKVIGPRAGEVPEPGVLSLLLGSGVGGSLLALRRRIRK